MIPTVGLVDTDCDPACVDYPIPANDDSVESVQLMLSLFSRAVTEGKELLEKNPVRASPPLWAAQRPVAMCLCFFSFSAILVKTPRTHTHAHTHTHTHTRTHAHTRTHTHTHTHTRKQCVRFAV